MCMPTKKSAIYMLKWKKKATKENYGKPYMSECKTNINPKLKLRMLKD